MRRRGVSAGVLVLALAAFGAAAGFRAERAVRQAEIARRETSFLAEMFHGADGSLTEPFRVRKLVDRAVQRAERDFAAEPQVHAQLLQKLAGISGDLGLADMADSLARESLILTKRLYGETSPQAWDAVEFAARTDGAGGLYIKAEDLLARLEAQRRATYGQTSPEAAAVATEIGKCLYLEGKTGEAISLLRRTLAIDRIDGPKYGAATRNYLALALERKGDFEEARRLLEEAVAITRGTPGNMSPEYASSLQNLGTALAERGDPLGAAGRLREAADIRRKTAREDDPGFGLSMHKLGAVLLDAGDWREAEPVIQKSLHFAARNYAPDDPRLAEVLVNLGRVTQAEGAYEDAGNYFNRSLSILRNANAMETWQYAGVLANLGLLAFDRADYGRAERYARETMDLRRRLGGDSTPAFADSLADLAQAIALEGDLKGAERLLRQALEIRRQKLPEGHPAIVGAVIRLGEVLVAEKNTAEAEPMLREAVAAPSREPFPLLPWRIAEARNALGECLRTQGSWDEAVPLMDGSRGPLMDHPRPAFRQGVVDALRKRIRG